MLLSAAFAGAFFLVLRDHGLEAVWETLLAFQVRLDETLEHVQPSMSDLCGPR
jgi:hypothetical protein